MTALDGLRLTAKRQVSSGLQAFATVTGTDGAPRQIMYIATSPAQLAAQAGVDIETYSLARVLASEGYGGEDVGEIWAIVAIAQAVVNTARARGKNITALVTASTWGTPLAGHYGEQSGRYAATSADPREWHLAVARAVLQGAVPDLARGATQFFDPLVQDGGVQRGTKIKTADAILQSWHAHSAWIGQVPMIDPYALMFLRPEPNPVLRAAALSAALAAVYDGRQRTCLVNGHRRICTPKFQDEAEPVLRPTRTAKVAAVSLIAVALVGGLAYVLLGQDQPPWSKRHSRRWI